MFLVNNFLQKNFLKYFKILIRRFNSRNIKLGKVINFWWILKFKMYLTFIWYVMLFF